MGDDEETIVKRVTVQVQRYNPKETKIRVEKPTESGYKDRNNAGRAADQQRLSKRSRRRPAGEDGRVKVGEGVL
jgi:hypothetical protein